MAAVLFVHGLESGPRGTKAQRLAAAGFDVIALQMPCGRRAVLRDWPGWGGALVVLVGAVVAVFVVGGVTAASACVAIVTAVVAGLVGRVVLMRRVWRRSVATQVAALRGHAIDAVVGSSFGGAVALELLRSGAWRGPTLLLCPAHRLVAARGWRRVPALPPELPPTLVVHGRGDRVVPLADSVALATGTAAALHVVDDDHGLRRVATVDAFAAWLAELGVRPASIR